MPPLPVRHVIGCMTGTSLDALDSALIAVTGTGLDMRIRLLNTHSQPLDNLGTSLRTLADGGVLSAREIASAALAFGQLHADAATELAALAPGGRVDLAALHGQTVFHAPPVSWQLINPWPVAHALRCPVVFDLRGADLAAGGQGAPITPLFDWLTLRDPHETVVVVNLGGFCNITVLPRDIPSDATPLNEPFNPNDQKVWQPLTHLRGFDVCACNQLLDAVARHVFGTPYDNNGLRAAAGAVNLLARDDLIDRLAAQSSGGRSLGTGDELAAWISKHVTGAHTPLAPNDLARTVAEAVGTTIGSACRQHGATRILLAGGGIHHQILVSAIGNEARVKPTLTDHFGVSAAYREAMAIAALGALCQDRVPITLPQVTSCSMPVGVSGCWVIP